MSNIANKALPLLELINSSTLGNAAKVFRSGHNPAIPAQHQLYICKLDAGQWELGEL